MTEDRTDDNGKRRPSNDNCPPDGQASGTETTSSERLDAGVLSIARLIGRRMAREDFAAQMAAAANDNAPKSGGEPGGGAGKV